jgi:hypothetical protein
MVTFPKLNLVIYNFNLLVLSFTWNFLSLKVFNSSFVSCDIYIYDTQHLFTHVVRFDRLVPWKARWQLAP